MKKSYEIKLSKDFDYLNKNCNYWCRYIAFGNIYINKKEYEVTVLCDIPQLELDSVKELDKLNWDNYTYDGFLCVNPGKTLDKKIKIIKNEGKLYAVVDTDKIKH